MKTIICQPLSVSRYVVPCSTIVVCAVCQQRMWLSPSGLAMREAADRLVCVPCLHAECPPGEPIQIQPLTAWQRREITAAGINLEAAR